MVSMPNPFIPPAVCAAVAVGGGIVLAFLRTRSRAAVFIVVDVLLMAFALLPVEILAKTLIRALPDSAPNETLWLASMVLVSLPLSYLPPRIAWMTRRPIWPALMLGALLAVTRVYSELILAVMDLEHFTVIIASLFLASLACGYLIARALPSR